VTPAIGSFARGRGCGCRRPPVCLGVPGTDLGSALSYEQRPRASCLCHWGEPARSPPVLRGGSRWAKLDLAW
jgi:hypothetical protein